MHFCHETWKEIPGYEGYYEVSDQGHVRSVDREIVQDGRWGFIKRTMKGRLLSPSNEHSNYPHVILSRGNEKESVKIHLLALRAFVGPCPEGLQACHEDGDTRNNILSNLRWGTPKSNQADRVGHGTHQYGARGPRAKLTWGDVFQIRSIYRASAPCYAEVGRRFGVCATTIGQIVRRDTWDERFYEGDPHACV